MATLVLVGLGYHPADAYHGPSFPRLLYGIIANVVSQPVDEKCRGLGVGRV
jgi:hypothetical protein